MDYKADVWLNSQDQGGHEGGSRPISPGASKASAQIAGTPSSPASCLEYGGLQAEITLNELPGTPDFA